MRRKSTVDSTDADQTLYAQLNTAAAQGNPVWLDVIPLPLPRIGAGGVLEDGSVVIAQRYENFTGRYVMHCHIPGHEDAG